MIQDLPYPCTSCGACCKRVNRAPLYFGKEIYNKGSLFYFPYKWDETGKCEMLIDNKCSVYNDRPLICNIDKLADILEIPKELFYRMNAIACNTIIDEDGIEESFKINIP